MFAPHWAYRSNLKKEASFLKQATPNGPTHIRRLRAGVALVLFSLSRVLSRAQTLAVNLLCVWQAMIWISWRPCRVWRRGATYVDRILKGSAAECLDLST